jgi:hypothetical protein
MKKHSLPRWALGTIALALFVACGLVLSTISSPAFAGGRCSKSVLCDAYKHPRSGYRTPSTNNVICIYYEQATFDTIILKAFANGRVLDLGNTRHNIVNAPPSGRICIGAGYVEAADRIEICNSVKRRILRPQHLDTLLRLGRTPQGDPVPLFRS